MSNLKIKNVNSIPFLVCLTLLLLNDFFLKYSYHNYLTGKLSDFCGLYVFVIFWSALLPKYKKAVFISTAFLFVLWKSPYSQGFIKLFSSNIYPIDRVVDPSDLFALLILPLAYYFSSSTKLRLKMHPIFPLVLSAFSFLATSVPRHSVVFDPPQYLLFKPNSVELYRDYRPNNFNLYNLDSMIVIGISELGIEKEPVLLDDYFKNEIIDSIDLHFIREAIKGYSHHNLNQIVKHRDSIVLKESTTVMIDEDWFLDSLNFKNAKLDGAFKRISTDGNLLISGRYKEGIKDSIWDFYNENNELISKEYYRNGEQHKVEYYKDMQLVSTEQLKTRKQVVSNKYFVISLIILLIAFLSVILVRNYMKLKKKHTYKLSLIMSVLLVVFFPILSFVAYKVLKAIIPNSSSFDFFWILGKFLEFITFYICLALIYLFIIEIVRLRRKYELLIYLILPALCLNLFNEINFLIKII